MGNEVGGRLTLLAVIASCVLHAGCSSMPEQAASAGHAPSDVATRLPAPSGAPLDALGVVAYATSMQGKPYRAGGESPALGFDCSGLVRHVFAQFAHPLPRNAAAMAAELPAVPIDAVQAADLLFFNTQGNPFSHVGIYLGDGRFVHAPSPGTGHVIVSSMSNRYWHGRLTAARRPALAAPP